MVTTRELKSMNDMNNVRPSSSAVDQYDPSRTIEELFDEEQMTTNGSGDQDHDYDEKLRGKGDIGSRQGIFRRAATRFPRLYHILVGVVLPLFLLIGLSLAFGCALARLESTGEIYSNDLEMRQLYQQYLDYAAAQEAVRMAIENVHPICLREFDNNITFRAMNESQFELFTYLDSCYARKAQENFATVSAREYYHDLVFLLEFNWINCPREGNTLLDNFPYNITNFDRAMQTEHYIAAFENDFAKLTKQREADGLNRETAVARALEEATGSAECKPHFAGGAFFWFTVMTTIGYGNTSPATDGGRALIFTFGFVSIIAFTALIGQAGHITLAIVDDAFRQSKWLRPLARGLPSVLFWLFTLVLWMLFHAQIYRIYTVQRHGLDSLDMVPFKDAIWFSYITLTTVGLGDIHLSHEEFVTADMFYVPLLVLFGFVWLANFALKLGKFLLELCPGGEDIDDLMEQQRRRKRKQQPKA